jgi:hypothetical protein
MPRTWLFPGLLLAVFAVIALAQQAADELTDQERIVQLEEQMTEMQRALVTLAGDGAVEMTPAALETRLARIEMRLGRLEQQAIRFSGSADAASGRMMDSRLRALENAVMRLQQQR